MNRIIRMVVLIVLIMCPHLNIGFTICYSSASGSVNLEPGEWWFYLMIAEEGARIVGEFETDGHPMQWFMTHETNYHENMTIDPLLTLDNGYESIGEFDLITPEDGGWFLVFVNLATVDMRIEYSWEAFDSLSTIALNYVFPIILTGIIVISGFWYFKKWKKSC